MQGRETPTGKNRGNHRGAGCVSGRSRECFRGCPVAGALASALADAYADVSQYDHAELLTFVESTSFAEGLLFSVWFGG